MTLFGQTMFLVGLSIGFLAFGSLIGRDIALGTARILSFVAIGMIFAQSFVAPLRSGRWASRGCLRSRSILGLSLGPVLSFYLSSDPVAVTQAAGGTAITTIGMGAYGLATSKDLAHWIRPLSYRDARAAAISLVLLLFGSGGSPLISLAVLAVSAALLIVDFNYLRRHATEDDVVWLATGIFVSIVNIFLSLLNLFGRN